MAKGTINVQTENIFPIIKKFLYSDHEIFLRELVANAVDACQKIQTIALKGEKIGELGDLEVEIKIDKEAKTLHIIDNGIGMTAEEVDKYINQIAFSGASDFVKKFKDDASIIGKFGLGFYSSFMVSDKVELITKSYKRKKGATWTGEGTPEYELEENDIKNRGTEIVLHINEDNKEFLEEPRVRELLNKYCKFLPVPIKFGTKEVGEGEDKKVEDVIINNPEPAWTKKPTKLKDEDYKSFYTELYGFSEPPLFWIHLNVDHPFKLTGILYFPKLKNSYEVQKNKINLYQKQVFVTDQVEEIVPEFLMLLHGVIDSPDIPLNVSRSYLQSDQNVKKINSYITKKVADKLKSNYKKDEKEYEKNWEHVGLFAKYGMLSDPKFAEKAKNFCLLENMKGKFYLIEDYIKRIKKNQTNKDKKQVILYTTNADEQDSYIKNAENAGFDVLKLDTIIDPHFVSHLEQNNVDVTLARVDAGTLNELIDKGDEAESVLSTEEQDRLKELYESLAKNEGTTVELKPLSPTESPVVITRPEFTRRMKDMAAMGGGGMQFYGEMPDQINVIVNTNHALATKVLKAKKNKEKYAMQLVNLAKLSQGLLKGAELTAFVNESVDLMDE